MTDTFQEDLRRIAQAQGRRQDRIDDFQSLASAVNAFALALYGEAGGEAGNVFFSPYSLHTALAMTSVGAKGVTRTEMGLVLGTTAKGGAVPHAAIGAYGDVLAMEATLYNYELAAANRLWPSTSYSLLEAYLQQVGEAYGAGVEPLDYEADPEAARQRINRWVAEKTRDRIKDLVKQGMITSGTPLVLTNAIYFLARWDNVFDASRTKPAPFTLPSGNTTQAPMMNRCLDARYADAGDVALLELPYQGESMSMVLLLPKRPDGLSALSSSLTADRLPALLGAMRTRHVEVFLPRFRIGWDAEMAAHLAATGMPSAFTYGQADFSGMDGTRELVISKVLHKAFVEVTEEGTEAAAATAIMMMAGCAPGEPPKPVIFRADHPFLFLIRDTQTGAILFMGRLVDPAA